MRRQILSYLESINRHAIIPEAEFVILIWNGLLTAVDMTSKPEQINDLVVKEVSVSPPRLFHRSVLRTEAIA